MIDVARAIQRLRSPARFIRNSLPISTRCIPVRIAYTAYTQRSSNLQSKKLHHSSLENEMSLSEF